ncbi:hypothetical protein NPIL_466071 [Nephila pilipes]|uniref:Uncharacterized protein n=1 Tax=Nephila pilipes TaxID=299642 RepID=A0A8X6PKV3_NEPPI|nr:hypothetical protein NPIL_466071 [Nephila pilipes]
MKRDLISSATEDSDRFIRDGSIPRYNIRTKSPRWKSVNFKNPQNTKKYHTESPKTTQTRSFAEHRTFSKAQDHPKLRQTEAKEEGQGDRKTTRHGIPMEKLQRPKKRTSSRRLQRAREARLHGTAGETTHSQRRHTSEHEKQ